MRRIHLIIGLLGVIALLLTGQAMKHHHPRMEELSAEVRMLYVSRHVYLLGASLVNVVLGLYLLVHPQGWRRVLQAIGSVVILLSPLLLLIAFFAEPAFGLAGRSWRSYFGLIGLFAGVMTHIVASAGMSRGLIPKSRLLVPNRLLLIRCVLRLKKRRPGNGPRPEGPPFPGTSGPQFWQ